MGYGVSSILLMLLVGGAPFPKTFEFQDRKWFGRLVGKWRNAKIGPTKCNERHTSLLQRGERAQLLSRALMCGVVVNQTLSAHSPSRATSNSTNTLKWRYGAYTCAIVFVNESCYFQQKKTASKPRHTTLHEETVD